MPEMSGYETLAQMQVVDPDVKVIVITGMEAEPGTFARNPRHPDKTVSSRAGADGR